MLYLFKPPGPVMADIQPPIVHSGPDALVLQNPMQQGGTFLQRILPGALTHADDDLPLVVHPVSNTMHRFKHIQILTERKVRVG